MFLTCWLTAPTIQTEPAELTRADRSYCYQDIANKMMMFVDLSEDRGYSEFKHRFSKFPGGRRVLAPWSRLTPMKFEDMSELDSPVQKVLRKMW